jgi:RNA polymerase sigma factor (sigma-70 family)
MSIMGANSRQEICLVDMEAGPGMESEDAAERISAESGAPSSEQVAEEAVSGAEDFYARYLAPMESRMARAVWRIVRNQDRARDVVQDALTTIWRRQARIQDHPNPQALILRICLNTACDSLRRLRQERRCDDPDVCVQLRPDGAIDVPSQLAAKELKAQVQAAIAHLPAQQAAAVLMRTLEEQSYSEIAQALGCSAITARVHVMRGRARLRRMLAHLATGEPNKE